MTQIFSKNEEQTLTLQQVASVTDIKPYVLRFWETEFDHLQTQRTFNGQRVYTSEDIENLLKIKKLLFEDKMSIVEAKKFLDDERSNDQVDQNFSLEQSEMQLGLNPFDSTNQVNTPLETYVTTPVAKVIKPDLSALAMNLTKVLDLISQARSL